MGDMTVSDGVSPSLKGRADSASRHCYGTISHFGGGFRGRQ